jgi:hypothetical protein
VKNLTIDLDEEMTSFVCMDAAKRGVSVAEYVGKLVQECVKDAREYNEARSAFLALRPFKCEFIDGHVPTRDELHDRTRFR